MVQTSGSDVQVTPSGDELCSLFRLLADRTRLSILLRLSDGEKNVSTLCEELGLPQPTVSHHLGLLRTSAIVSSRRSGKQVFYSLNNRSRPADGTALHFRLGEFAVRVERIDPSTHIAT